MEGRLASLRAVADALIPPLEERAAAVSTVDPRAAALFRHSGCSDEVLYKVIELIEVRLPPEARRELFLLLRLMGSRLGSMLLLGRAAFSSRLSLPTSFRDLPRQQREAVLQAWSASPDPRMRKAFKGLKSLILSVQFSYLAPDGTSDLLAAMRYPITDPQRPALPAPAAAAAETAVTAALVDLSAHDSSPGSAAGAGAALAAKGMRVLWPGDFGGSAAAAREHPQLAVQCDVVVVGSGAGGGVVAANLARAGLKVVVLEKAGFVPAREMSLQEGETFRSMYEQGGILASEDASITVLAGSTLGGGTRVNWCASFKTPAHVRREWAAEHGLPAFASPAYDEALEAVCSRLGVHTGFKHSGMCSALQGGLQGLGVHCEEVPRNCLNPDCGGHCCLGCARGGKQDTVNTWLADACQAGARIITGVSAECVILDSNTGGDRSKGGHSRGRKAVGVLALAGTTAAPLRLAILASTVVSSAGTIHSPALLLRSGISCGGAVGTNLRLHPCTCVVGVFPPGHRQQPQQQQAQGQAPQQPATGRSVGDLEDLAGAPGSRTGGQEAQPQQEQQQQEQRRLHMVPGQEGGSIRCWEGTLMSIFSNQVGDWEGSGYGSLLYTPAVHPGLFAAAAPWVSGEDHKELMLQYADCCIVLVLVRDQDAGRVTIDRSGRPRIHYTLSKRDEGSMNKGIELGLRCMAAAGAHTVLTMLNSPAGRFAFTQLGDAPGDGTGSGSDGAAGSGNPAGGGDSQANGAAGDAAAGQQEAVLAGSAAGGREAFESYLERVAQTGVVPLQMPLFCAHQMGTCRLGASPTTSVTDMSGECWDVAGLFCMDGSALPTSTGVNPMISIEATAYMLSKQLGARLIKATGAVDSGGGNKRHGGKRRASPSPKL